MNNLPLLKLEPGQVHIWYTCPDDIQTPDILASYHAMMSFEEQEKQSRYIMPWRRHTSLVSRAVVRCALSRYSPTMPHEWKFQYNEYGKPEIVRGDQDPPLEFNLSHTQGLIALAVSLDSKVGIDVERCERQRDFDRLSARYFAKEEVEQLHGLREYSKRQLFFMIWTLKEAYVKAKGQGVSMGLDRFFFRFTSEGVPIAHFGEDLQEDPEHWKFWVMAPTKFHKTAVALQKEPGSDCQVESRFFVPTAEEKLVE